MTASTSAARASDAINARLSEPGKYIGVFTRVEPVTSTKGTHGISFSFKASSGESTDFIDLWTVNAAGAKLGGYESLMGILTCASVRGMKPVEMTVYKYDRDLRKSVPTKIMGFPELTNKPIGLLFQKELSSNNGKDYENMRIVGSFNPETELTASEILDKATEPKQLAKHLEWLTNHPVKDNRSAASKQQSQQHAAMDAQAPDGPAPRNFDGFEDDLPF